MSAYGVPRVGEASEVSAINGKILDTHSDAVHCRRTRTLYIHARHFTQAPDISCAAARG